MEAIDRVDVVAIGSVDVDGCEGDRSEAERGDRDFSLGRFVGEPPVGAPVDLRRPLIISLGKSKLVTEFNRNITYQRHRCEASHESRKTLTLDQFVGPKVNEDKG